MIQTKQEIQQTPGTKTVPHEWRGGGWRDHVVSWAGLRAGLQHTSRQVCSVSNCRLNQDEEVRIAKEAREVCG